MMLNQYAVDYPTFPVNQRYSHFFRDPGGMLSRSVGTLSRNDKPRDIWDTHGISENVFCKPNGVFSLSLNIDIHLSRKMGDLPSVILLSSKHHLLLSVFDW